MFLLAVFMMLGFVCIVLGGIVSFVAYYSSDTGGDIQIIFIGLTLIFLAGMFFEIILGNMYYMERLGSGTMVEVVQE